MISSVDSQLFAGTDLLLQLSFLALLVHDGIQHNRSNMCCLWMRTLRIVVLSSGAAKCSCYSGTSFPHKALMDVGACERHNQRINIKQEKKHSQTPEMKCSACCTVNSQHNWLAWQQCRKHLQCDDQYVALCHSRIFTSDPSCDAATTQQGNEVLKWYHWNIRVKVSWISTVLEIKEPADVSRVPCRTHTGWQAPVYVAAACQQCLPPGCSPSCSVQVDPYDRLTKMNCWQTEQFNIDG